MKNFSALFLFWLGLLGQSFAQSGSWNPAGANLSYPRTLLKTASIPAVQTALAEPESYGLYSGLYGSITGTPPSSNTSASGRRTRATFAKNAAFVVLLNRKPSGGALVTLSATEKTALITKTVGLLESLNPQVENFSPLASPNYTEWQWRSKELIDYLIAYDLLRGAAVAETALTASKARLQEFAGNLYAKSTQPYFGVTFYAAIKNNHALMTAAALGMAAVVLNDATSTLPQQWPANWINVGMYHIDNVLWQDAQRQSDPTAVAGYAEGPYYFKYAFLNCLPFFRAMGHFLPDASLTYTQGNVARSIRNPYYDPRYDRLYDWITAILMPDGRFPALEDSYVDMGIPELALTGKRQYVKPLYLSKLTSSQLNSLSAQLRETTVDMRAAYLAANISPTTPANPPLTVLPQSGNLVFRSGNTAAASYLHVYGKNGLAQTNSGGHNHADASSFILHAYGQLLALDPGYLSSTRRAEVGQATNHNMLLVNGGGPAIGTAGSANDALATIQNTFQTPKLAYGEVQTAYNNARITRKTLFVRNTYYLLADFISATTPNTYTWQLHGYGLEGGTTATGTFTDNLAAHEGSWQKNGVRLKAHVTATGGATAYTKATNIHEITYNVTENHTTLLVQKAGVAQTQFVSALYPFVTNSAQISTTSTPTTAGLASTTTGFKDVVFAQADTILTSHSSNALPQAVRADGLLNFYSADSTGQFAQLFLQQGTTLQVGSSKVVFSSKRANISWQKDAATRYEGYVSRGGLTLTLTLPQAPTTVQGDGIASFQYDAQRQLLHLVVNQATHFSVLTTPAQLATPLPVELASFGAKRETGAVHVTWQTASEHNNQGFAVQRRTEAEASFAQVGFLAGAGNTTGRTTYVFRDATAPATPVYYRLKQLDDDGTATYSPVVAVAGIAPAAPVLAAYPIPAHDQLTVSFSDPAQLVQLRLMNQQGQVVLQQAFRQQTQLKLNALPPGLYYLQALNTAGNVLSKSIKLAIE